MNRDDLYIVGHASYLKSEVKGKDLTALKKKYPTHREDVLKALEAMIVADVKAKKEAKEAKAAEKAKANEANKADK